MGPDQFELLLKDGLEYPPPPKDLAIRELNVKASPKTNNADSSIAVKNFVRFIEPSRECGPGTLNLARSMSEIETTSEFHLRGRRCAIYYTKDSIMQSVRFSKKVPGPVTIAPRGGVVAPTQTNINYNKGIGFVYLIL